MLHVGLPADVVLEFMEDTSVWCHSCGVLHALQILGNSDPGLVLAFAGQIQLVGSLATVVVGIIGVVDLCPTLIVREFGVALIWCSTS